MVTESYADQRANPMTVKGHALHVHLTASNQSRISMDIQGMQLALQPFTFHRKSKMKNHCQHLVFFKHTPAKFHESIAVHAP
jgi:hypothetical protein